MPPIDNLKPLEACKNEVSGEPQKSVNHHQPQNTGGSNEQLDRDKNNEEQLRLTKPNEEESKEPVVHVKEEKSEVANSAAAKDCNNEQANYQEELQELQDLAFQPTLHQLYEDELFPELEFSFKHSEVSCVAAPHEHEHDSSLEEVPKLPDSESCEDFISLNGMKNARGRCRHRSEKSSGSSQGGFGANSQRMGRRVSPLNLRGGGAGGGNEHDNDRDGDGGDAVEQHSEGVNAYHQSSRINDQQQDGVCQDYRSDDNLIMREDRKPFKLTASYQDL